MRRREGEAGAARRSFPWIGVLAVLVAQLACAQLLAATERTVLDPGGRVDLALAGLTGLTLLLRLVTYFVLPGALVFGLLAQRRTSGSTARGSHWLAQAKRYVGSPSNKT